MDKSKEKPDAYKHFRVTLGKSSSEKFKPIPIQKVASYLKREEIKPRVNPSRNTERSSDQNILNALNQAVIDEQVLRSNKRKTSESQISTLNSGLSKSNKNLQSIESLLIPAPKYSKIKEFLNQRNAKTPNLFGSVVRKLRNLSREATDIKHFLKEKSAKTERKNRDESRLRPLPGQRLPSIDLNSKSQSKKYLSPSKKVSLLPAMPKSNSKHYPQVFTERRIRRKNL